MKRDRPKPSNPSRLNYFANLRQLWIAEALRVFGFVNREHLIRKFDISQPQASLDLKLFQRANPTALSYNPTFKCYVSTATALRIYSAQEPR